MRKPGKKFLLYLLLTGILLCLFPATAKAEETKETEGLAVSTEYYSVTSGEPTSFKIFYTDQWFCLPSTAYNHDLAKASLGLMTSCFRPGTSEKEFTPETTDRRARAFLESTGFSGIRSDDFDRPSGRYTVSSVIGRKSLIGPDGQPFTLLAVGICGQGYQNEWLSNLSIGDMDDHVGFEDASQDVYDRIFGYIAENGITGRIKIWTSGFSRSAAVGNLLSAKLIRSERIAPEDLFAYLYATPRCTKQHTEGDFPGIFNIVGMTDPVPQVPFLDWGYDRYGTTFYLPSQETDSDYFSKREGAAVVFEKLTGKELKNNPEMNARVKMLLEYLLILCPTPEIYKEHMQSKLLKLWDDKSPVTLLKVLLELADDPVLITEENRKEANGFLNYLSYLLFDFMLRNDEFSNADDDGSLAVTIMREHLPDVYISWMLSKEDPNDLFAPQNEYTRVVISGDVDIMIYNDTSEALIQEVHSDGTVDYYNPGTELFSARQKTQTILIIPRDCTYLVGIVAEKDQVTKLIQIHYTSEQTRETEYQTRDADMKKDELLVLTLPIYNQEESGLNLVTEQEEIQSLRFSYGESTSSILAFERLNIFHLNWRSFVILFITITGILAAILAFQITYAVGALRYRRSIKNNALPKGTKYHPLPVLALCTIYVLFLAEEFISALYPASIWVKPVFKAAIGILLFFVTYTGYRQSHSPLHYWVMIGLIVSSAADLLINSWLNGGAILHCAALLIFCYAFYTYERPAPWQLALAAVLIYQGVFGFLDIVPPGYSLSSKILAGLYFSAGILLITVSLGVPRRFRTGAILIVISGALLVINFLTQETFFSHFLSLGTYYLGLCFIASGTLIHPHTLAEMKKDAAPPAPMEPASSPE